MVPDAGPDADTHIRRAGEQDRGVALARPERVAVKERLTSKATLMKKGGLVVYPNLGVDVGRLGDLGFSWHLSRVMARLLNMRPPQISRVHESYLGQLEVRAASPTPSPITSRSAFPTTLLTAGDARVEALC